MTTIPTEAIISGVAGGAIAVEGDVAGVVAAAMDMVTVEAQAGHTEEAGQQALVLGVATEASVWGQLRSMAAFQDLALGTVWNYHQG